MGSTRSGRSAPRNSRRAILGAIILTPHSSVFRYCDKENLTCGKGEPKLVGDATSTVQLSESFGDDQMAKQLEQVGGRRPTGALHMDLTEALAKTS